MSNTEIKRPVLSLNVVGPSDDNNEFIVGTMVDGNDQYPAIQFGGTTFEVQNGELHISGDLVVDGDVYTDGSDEPVGPGGGGTDILDSDNVFTGKNTFEQGIKTPLVGEFVGTEDHMFADSGIGFDVNYNTEDPSSSQANFTLSSVLSAPPEDMEGSDKVASVVSNVNNDMAGVYMESDTGNSSAGIDVESYSGESATDTYIAMGMTVTVPQDEDEPFYCNGGIGLYVEPVMEDDALVGVKSIASMEADIINLNAQEVLVNGEPISGGGSDILDSDNVFTGVNTFEQPLNASTIGRTITIEGGPEDGSVMDFSAEYNPEDSLSSASFELNVSAPDASASHFVHMDTNSSGYIESNTYSVDPEDSNNFLNTTNRIQFGDDYGITLSQETSASFGGTDFESNGGISLGTISIENGENPGELVGLKSVINLEADEVLVNGAPIGGGVLTIPFTYITEGSSSYFGSSYTMIQFLEALEDGFKVYFKFDFTGTTKIPYSGATMAFEEMLLGQNGFVSISLSPKILNLILSELSGEGAYIMDMNNRLCVRVQSPK